VFAVPAREDLLAEIRRGLDGPLVDEEGGRALGLFEIRVGEVAGGELELPRDRQGLVLRDLDGLLGDLGSLVQVLGGSYDLPERLMTDFADVLPRL
jgi:hypothetical protein